jgi:hypothetical protein
VNVLQRGLIPALVLSNYGKRDDLAPEKRGTQSVTVQHGTVNMYSYSFRFSVRDENGSRVYGRCGVVSSVKPLE